MRSNKTGWTNFLHEEGPDFLAWIAKNDILTKKFDLLAKALWALLKYIIRTPDDARNVWMAVPCILGRCNEQATYEIPGAPVAYAWLHLLDRYVRTWKALEQLVINCSLPLGRNGVNALDVGTGPGPAAFAVNDFYSAMLEFAAQIGHTKWHQPPKVTCVEYDAQTNSFRHHLAELVAYFSHQQTTSVYDLAHAIHDFGKLLPRDERRQLFKSLRWGEDQYFNESTGEWDSEPRYTAEEANDMAQSIHRYRLIIFSNFLTTVGIIDAYETNIVEIFTDAQPGTILMVLGGMGTRYSKIYQYIDRLAKQAGFELAVEGLNVTANDTPLTDRIYAEGLKVYKLLQNLDPKGAELTPETRKVQKHFTNSRGDLPSSQLWAYRKRRSQSPRLKN